MPQEKTHLKNLEKVDAPLYSAKTKLGERWAWAPLNDTTTEKPSSTGTKPPRGLGKEQDAAQPGGTLRVRGDEQSDAQVGVREKYLPDRGQGLPRTVRSRLGKESSWGKGGR